VGEPQTLREALDRDLIGMIRTSWPMDRSAEADALDAAMTKHPATHSPHEGWAVIWEELDELWAHVRADTGRTGDARKEAMQVAAMGLRYALDLPIALDPRDLPDPLDDATDLGPDPADAESAIEANSRRLDEARRG